MLTTSRRSGRVLFCGLLFATAAACVGYEREARADTPRANQSVLVAKPGAQVGSADGAVQLRARPDRGAVLSGSDGRVHVEVTLSATDAAAGDVVRQPSDVLVVLDISGSMSGQKLAYAKEALHQLVDRLAPSDRFGLVTYDSSAELLVPLQPATQRALARFRSVVDALDTRGNTNMSAGLDLGIAQLRHSRARGRSARVLLLSDGHANQGDSSIAGLQQRARSIVRGEHVLTAMGIGDDFNEDLMAGLADSGAGNFYYLSRVETLGRYFDAELRAARQTLARALELRFEAAHGVDVLSVSGYPLDRDGRVVSVRPGNLYAGQKRTLWVTLAVPTQRLGQKPLGRFVLAYKRGERAYEATAGALPELACVADEAQFEAAVDRELWQDFVINERLRETELQLGAAVGKGDAADVDRATAGYEQHRKLAVKLGATRVIASFDDVQKRASEAKVKQNAAPAERAYRAKHDKARAQFKRRGDAYNDDPLMGLSDL